MTLHLMRTQYVDTAGGQTTGLASLFTLTGAGNPKYLVVNAIDRDEYAAAATGATGCFTGNGQSLGLTPDGSDGREAGIVFTWRASSRSYVNATYGALSELSWTDSRSAYDVTAISFFGTNSAAVALDNAGDVYDLAQADAGGYLGSVTFASANGYPGAGGNATPDGVAAAALGMVGKDWNENGCWVLASTIAAEAGSGLPVQSTMLGVPGAANGPWYVLFDGPAGSTGNWQSLVSTGDMVAFQTSPDSGHITTCVSGSGASAKLVDNITYVDASGAVTNAADDGSADDVVIAAPHLASEEFAGVPASSVVIYALDTPVVRDEAGSESVRAGMTLSLSNGFSVSDPLHKSIAGFEVYLSNAAGILQVKGHAEASSVSAPVSVSLLSGLSFLAGDSPGSDQIELRAFNGAYWGDWQDLTVKVTAAPGLDGARPEGPSAGNRDVHAGAEAGVFSPHHAPAALHGFTIL
jgi:hypothetical protein